MKLQNIKIKLLFLITCFFIIPSSIEAKKHNFVPINGYVPNTTTAISIAVAIWNPIYGKEKIKQEKPYKAKLRNGIWYVQGTLNCPTSPVCIGGVAEIEISKNNGMIYRVSHGK